MKLGDLGPEQPHVIADLRHCADRRTRGLDGVALLDGNGWRNAFDAIDLRFVHAIEELPGVRRKSLDIPALTLRKQGVESQRAFPRTAQTGDNDELIQRQIEVEILEIIVPDAPEADGRHH